FRPGIYKKPFRRILHCHGKTHMAADQDFDSEIEEGEEMTFLEHLEEFRWHIIRALGSIVVFAILAWVYREWIYGTIILGPSKTDFWTYRMLCKLGNF